MFVMKDDFQMGAGGQGRRFSGGKAFVSIAIIPTIVILINTIAIIILIFTAIISNMMMMMMIILKGIGKETAGQCPLYGTTAREKGCYSSS